MISKRYMCNNKDVLLTMNEFFNKLPREYGNNYYANLASVKIKYVRNLGNCCDAVYDADSNIIWYSSSDSLPHELFHMASNDRDKKKMGLEFGKVSSIDEGMAEYLGLKTFELSDSKYYPFEVMCADMILDYPLVLKSFLMANHNEFIQIFHEEDTVLALMDELDFYNKVSGYLLNMHYMDGVNAKFDRDALIDIKAAVNNVIRYITLLGMQNSDKININEYTKKMIKLLNKDNIAKYFKVFYPEYIDDTKEVIRKLVK